MPHFRAHLELRSHTRLSKTLRPSSSITFARTPMPHANTLLLSEMWDLSRITGLIRCDLCVQGGWWCGVGEGGVGLIA